MTYPGDSSLSADIQERILTTFAQAIDLTEKGSRKEAILGCDFVLRLDPLFEPARELLKRQRASQDTVSTEDLRSVIADAGVTLDLEAAAETPPPVSLQEAVEEAIDQPGQTPSPAETDSELMTTFANEMVDSPDAPIVTEPPELVTPTYEQPAYVADGAVVDQGTVATTENELFGPEKVDEGGMAEPLGATAQLDDESQRRITELLGEGQDAYDAGEYQAAIDSWSRVFLIDIDHDEASRRIEQARRVAAEADRQVEEVFHEAMSHLDSGDPELARETLSRVLDLQPSHLAAKEYLDRIDSGDVPPPGPTVLEDDAIGAGMPTSFDLDEDYEVEEGAEDLFASPDSIPLAAELDISVSTLPPPTSTATKRSHRTFLIVGSLVLALVVIGGWFLIDSWDTLFPNSESALALAAPQRIDPIARAKKLNEQGKTHIAIAQLRRLPPGDPHYAEAKTLIAQWETAQPTTGARGPSADEMARYDALVDRAMSAHASRQFLLTSYLLERAAAVSPLQGEALVVQADAEQALEPLSEQIQVFRSGDWEWALPTLWRMREADITNPDINRLMIDSYYNLGVRDLQRGSPEMALGKFEEALGLRPDDPTLKRLRAFSATYENRTEDLQYRIFVKYLPFR